MLLAEHHQWQQRWTAFNYLKNISRKAKAQAVKHTFKNAFIAKSFIIPIFSPSQNAGN